MSGQATDVSQIQLQEYIRSGRLAPDQMDVKQSQQVWLEMNKRLAPRKLTGGTGGNDSARQTTQINLLTEQDMLKME